jgi:hypothetical protein
MQQYFQSQHQRLASVGRVPLRVAKEVVDAVRSRLAHRGGGGVDDLTLEAVALVALQLGLRSHARIVLLGEPADAAGAAGNSGGAGDGGREALPSLSLLQALGAAGERLSNAAPGDGAAREGGGVASATGLPLALGDVRLGARPADTALQPGFQLAAALRAHADGSVHGSLVFQEAALDRSPRAAGMAGAERG